jgi:hypothetical protein
MRRHLPITLAHRRLGPNLVPQEAFRHEILLARGEAASQTAEQGFGAPARPEGGGVVPGVHEVEVVLDAAGGGVRFGEGLERAEARRDEEAQGEAAEGEGCVDDGSGPDAGFIEAKSSARENDVKESRGLT